MDFEAEFAAFSAEVEQLEPSAIEEEQKQPKTTTAVPTTTTDSTSHTPASTSNAPLTKGVKRKTLEPDTSTNAATTTTNGPPTKKPHLIASVAAVTAAPATINSSSSSTVESAYADLVAADRAALQARQAAASNSASYSSAGESTNSTAAAASTSDESGSGGYIPGQVYNGWLASIDIHGAPCWLPATPESIAAHATRAQQLADAEAIAIVAQKKQSKAAKEAAAAAAAADGTKSQVGSSKPGEKHHLRTAAGRVWDDPTLEDWPENDYRIFCGDLGNDVTDQLLTQVFERWPSFVRARVVRDKRSGKTKGFGFASFLSYDECIQALREIDGKYVGNRPIRLRRSDWQKRESSKDKSWTAKHNQFGNSVTAGSKKLHLY